MVTARYYNTFFIIRTSFPLIAEINTDFGNSFWNLDKSPWLTKSVLLMIMIISVLNNFFISFNNFFCSSRV